MNCYTQNKLKEKYELVFEEIRKRRVLPFERKDCHRDKTRKWLGNQNVPIHQPRDLSVFYAPFPNSLFFLNDFSIFSVSKTKVTREYLRPSKISYFFCLVGTNCICYIGLNRLNPIQFKINWFNNQFEVWASMQILFYNQVLRRKNYFLYRSFKRFYRPRKKKVIESRSI